MAKLKEKFNEFFFGIASPRPIAGLRIGVAFTLLLQALMCAPDYFEWYGTEGFLQGQLMERLSWGLPQTTQLIRFFGSMGVTEYTTLTVLGILYLLSLTGLLVGWKSRFCAIIAWAIHVMLGEGHATGYGIDLFGNISLFYFIWMPIGNYWSLDARAGKLSTAPSFEAGLSLRVWQIHLCLVYFISGYEKAWGSHWQGGEAIWRSLMLPVYKQYDFGWIASYPWISLALGWFTLFVEMGYPLFIFIPKTRILWIALTVGMHFGIAVFLGLHLFALMMAVFTICAFGLSLDLRSRALGFFIRKPVTGLRTVTQF